jgi:hypothetical protein
MKNLTCSRARELFEYDCDTGILVRRIAAGGKPTGSVVGKTNSKGYLVAKVDGKSYYIHRVIWLWVFVDWPIYMIDHRDEVNNNNRLGNLRDVDNELNQQNQANCRTDSTSMLRGVCFRKDTGKWQASISVRGRARTIGCFDSPQKAHNAYLAEKRVLHAGFNGKAEGL